MKPGESKFQDATTTGYQPSLRGSLYTQEMLMIWGVSGTQNNWTPQFNNHFYASSKRDLHKWKKNHQHDSIDHFCFLVNKRTSPETRNFSAFFALRKVGRCPKRGRFRSRDFGAVSTWRCRQLFGLTCCEAGVHWSLVAKLRATDVQVFRGEWDEEGVFVYQAFNEQIANWALQHQGFGGPHFNPVRMTWVKPSFAWVTL